MDKNALLDCSATNLFMDTKWIKLEHLILVYNIDGTQNSIGSITYNATLMMIYKRHKKKVMFEICNLGNEFTRCSSECNMAKYKKKKTACKACAFKYKASMEEVEDEKDKK